MKLTKAQIKKLHKHDWDIVEEKVDGKKQNCRWISVFPDDGSVFGEVVQEFGLTGDSDSVKLLVIATTEKD